MKELNETITAALRARQHRFREVRQRRPRYLRRLKGRGRQAGSGVEKGTDAEAKETGAGQEVCLTVRRRRLVVLVGCEAPELPTPHIEPEEKRHGSISSIPTDRQEADTGNEQQDPHSNGGQIIPIRDEVANRED